MLKELYNKNGLVIAEDMSGEIIVKFYDSVGREKTDIRLCNKGDEGILVKAHRAVTLPIINGLIHILFVNEF